MRYFIHIVSDTERIEDPEGAEFVDVEAATSEAVQSARDLMARELMEGRPVPLGWRVEVAAGDGTVVLAVPFAQLAFPPPVDNASAGGSLPAMSRAEVMAGAIAIQPTTTCRT
jgi:hypothetical protein